MSLTGSADGPPTKVGVSQADIVAGMMAAQGVLLALLVRERTGRGQKVDISMLDGQVALLTYQAGIFFATGKPPRRMGNKHPSIVPYETFRCRDGYINVGVGNDSLWATFCEAIGREELIRDPRFATNTDRVQNHGELWPILNEHFSSLTCREALQPMKKRGVPCGPVRDVAQVCTSPEVLAREMVVELDHPQAGRTKLTGVPIKLSETPGSVQTPPPLLGEHTEEVLEKVLKLRPEDRARLREEGVV